MTTATPTRHRSFFTDDHITHWFAVGSSVALMLGGAFTETTLGTALSLVGIVPVLGWALLVNPPRRDRAAAAHHRAFVRPIDQSLRHPVLHLVERT